MVNKRIKKVKEDPETGVIKIYLEKYNLDNFEKKRRPEVIKIVEKSDKDRISDKDKLFKFYYKLIRHNYELSYSPYLKNQIEIMQKLLDEDTYERLEEIYNNSGGYEDQKKKIKQKEILKKKKIIYDQELSNVVGSIRKIERTIKAKEVHDFKVINDYLQSFKNSNNMDRSY